MPTSNGQITARDLRQQLLKPVHFRSDVINDADFLKDQVVTFPDKLDNPIWTTAAKGGEFQNETITTTPTVFGNTFTIDIPSWVDAVSVLAIAHFQLTNTSGGDVLMGCGVEVDGDVLGGHNHEAVNNQTQVLTTSNVADLSGVAGSSITIQMECSISTGTNTSNSGRVRAFVVGTRD